ncbi:hypothetical protein EDC48_102390 [Gibbsiella quercinecans]|nr:hypothetical protein EDC48_102390 [Gibbsiella quercinecans]
MMAFGTPMPNPAPLLPLGEGRDEGIQHSHVRPCAPSPSGRRPGRGLSVFPCQTVRPFSLWEKAGMRAFSTPMPNPAPLLPLGEGRDEGIRIVKRNGPLGGPFGRILQLVEQPFQILPALRILILFRPFIQGVLGAVLQRLAQQLIHLQLIIKPVPWPINPQRDRCFP